jgi:hemerythrin
MAGVAWNDSMAVDVAIIDGQHRRLFDLIGRLHDAMARGEGSTVLGAIIDGLIEYANGHFATEEGYFEASAYPDCTAHKQQHQDFVAKVVDFKNGFDEGRLMLTLDVMDFLGDWLVEHIQGSDASYAPYLSREGAA